MISGYGRVVKECASGTEYAQSDVLAYFAEEPCGACSDGVKG
jgi:hypothetical protein